MVSNLLFERTLFETVLFGNLRYKWVNGRKRVSVIWASWRENMILLHGNKNEADQLALQHSLISTFVIHSLEGIIAILATCKILMVRPVSQGH